MFDHEKKRTTTLNIKDIYLCLSHSHIPSISVFIVDIKNTRLLQIQNINDIYLFFHFVSLKTIKKNVFCYIVFCHFLFLKNDVFIMHEYIISDK